MLGRSLRGRNEIEGFSLSDEQLAIFNQLEQTSGHLFITGKAGTGKSALLKYVASHTSKTVIKVAPTGISAMNIRGQTIHSLFKLPTGPIEANSLRIDTETHQLLQRVDSVIIDEISMVRADVIDAIDAILRRIRRRKTPFGGAQILAFGDVFQLPPVVESTEIRNYFAEKYGGPYFFNARVWKKADLSIYELQNVFRQSNKRYKDMLDEIRSGQPSSWVFDALRTRVTRPEQVIPKDTITLTSTNAAAQATNEERSSALRTRPQTYQALITGDIAQNAFPSERALTMRVGAQVIFLKNDAAGRWMNGTIGVVTKVSKRSVHVRCAKKTHEVRAETWEKVTYSYDEDSGVIKQNTSGTFTQLPLKLAWAITVHKSQGCTYNRVAIDLRAGVFAHGQTYVALSRCRSLENVYLLGELKPRDIIVDPIVAEFMKKKNA